jgi:hypothetical protein
VANFGNATVRAVPIRFYLEDGDGNVIATNDSTVVDDGLDSEYNYGGDIFTLGAIRSLPPGNYALVAALDPDDTMGDADRSDNIALLFFTVLPYVELDFCSALGLP